MSPTPRLKKHNEDAKKAFRAAQAELNLITAAVEHTAHGRIDLELLLNAHTAAIHHLTITTGNLFAILNQTVLKEDEEGPCETSETPST